MTKSATSDVKTIGKEKESILIKEVLSMVGNTVHTIWGPSTVDEVLKDDTGEWIVHLLEFGEEPYSIKLCDWQASLI